MHLIKDVEILFNNTGILITERNNNCLTLSDKDGNKILLFIVHWFSQLFVLISDYYVLIRFEYYKFFRTST